MGLLADLEAAETKRFADWKANHITSIVHQDAGMYDRFGIHKPSEFDFFQTDTRWGNSYLNQLCGISSPAHYFLSELQLFQVMFQKSSRYMRAFLCDCLNLYL